MNRRARLVIRKKVDGWNLKLQRDLKLKGEKAVLAEAIQNGDWNKIPLAERLVAHYPEVALPALASAADKSKETFVQSRFVQLMGKVPGERTLPLLLGELRKSPSLFVRVEVAWLLQDRGRRESVDAMIAGGMARRDEQSRCCLSVLVEVAFFHRRRCRKPEAIQPLAANLSKRPPEVRLAVVASLARREHTEAAAVPAFNSLISFSTGGTSSNQNGTGSHS